MIDPTWVSHTTEELFSKLRQVPLRGHPDVFVYKDAKLSIEEVTPQHLGIAQYYLMNPIMDLLEDISKNDIDFFQLQGYITRQPTGLDPIDMLPPIVEEQEDGSLLICDGAHRCATALRCGQNINVVVARGLPKEYPYYAFPNENGWDDVRYVDEQPEAKKNYRIEDYKSLFRDFNAVFNRVTRSRKKK